MQNSPLKTWRQNKKLSATKLALLAHVSAQVIYASECGDRLTIHPNVLQIIERVDGPAVSRTVAQQYVSWREAQGAAVLQELTAAVAEG